MATPAQTPTPGESELDNSSSINNLSSLLAEKGTVTSGTGDDDIETSSIEQLDWSEADEEELQQQEMAAAIAAVSKPLRPKVTYETIRKTETAVAEPELVIEEAKGSNKTGRSLSSSLLESMSSTVDSDGSSKKSVIENWASDVKDAVDRGEMEIEEEEAEDLINDDENEDSDEEMTVDEGGNNEGTGMRKRMKFSSSKNPMCLSSISSFAVDSNIDPLSNAPVLDDGPIWNKGPKRYRFQENRRFNQKLTFGVLLAVVLAIGLGLGNLVAYNECEAEYKATQPQLQEESTRNSEQRIRSTEASKTAESSIKDDEIPSKSPNPSLKPYDSNGAPKQPSLLKNTVPDLTSIADELPLEVSTEPESNMNDEESLLNRKKEEEPSLDSKYGAHMETLYKIVQSLDHLRRKIDKFENNSRQLGGVVVLKDLDDNEPTILETIKEEPVLLDEQVYEDHLKELYSREESSDTDEDEDDAELNDIMSDLDGEWMDKVIYGIEESADYVKYQDKMRYYEELERVDEDENDHHRGFVKPVIPLTEEDREFGLKVKAYFEVTRKAEEEFIREQRDELREMKMLGLAEERTPEDYSTEEKTYLKKKYNKYMKEFPFTEEVDKLVEQLKGQTDKEEPLVDEINFNEHFLDDLDNAAHLIRDMFGEDEDNDEDFTFQPVHKSEPEDVEMEAMEYERKAEKLTRKDIQVEPRKDLVATDVEKNFDKNHIVEIPSTRPSKQEISWQDFSKGDEDEINNKRLKREKSPKKEYPKKKSDKRKKNSKAQTNFDEYDDSVQRQSEQKENIDRKVSRNGKSKKANQDDSGSYKNKKSEKKHRNSKEYKEIKQLNDFDYDDAEHKRKRYSESNKENYNKNNNNHNQRRGQKESNSDWLSERSQARDDNNQQLADKDNSEYLPHSSGKKLNNWQVERERTREKVRSKNPKNKSYNN